MNLGKSLTVLRSPTLADDSECYVTVYKEYLPSQLKDTGRVRELVKDTQGSIGTYQENTYLWKGMGGGSFYREISRARLKNTGVAPM